MMTDGNGNDKGGDSPDSAPHKKKKRRWQPPDWRSLERHPLSAEYPDIEGPAWERFVNDVREHKVVGGRVVTLYQNMVLDGWQLHRACVEAGIKPEYRQKPQNVPAEKFVQIVNDNRRHESQDVMEARAAKRRERVAAAVAEGKSNRAIAEQEGVSEATVRNDKAALRAQGAHVNPPYGQITDSTGRQQPATKKTTTQKDDTDDTGALLDSLDCPVPPGLNGVFNKVRAFREIVNQLNAINRELENLKSSAAGAELRLQQAQVDLKNLKETVRFDTPYCVCPVCKGNAKTRKTNCPCKDRGWLLEGQYKNLPTEYRP